HRHLVPGLIHLTAIDTADGELIKHHLIPVDRNILGRNPQHRDLCAVAHISEHLAKSPRVTRHLQTNVEALMHTKLLLNFLERRSARINRKRNPDLLSELTSIL